MRFRQFEQLFVRSPKGRPCVIPNTSPAKYYPEDSLTPVPNDRLHRVAIGNNELELDMVATKRGSAEPLAKPKASKPTESK